MKVEKPCSPGHCLGMLNANMRSDILRSIHQNIEERGGDCERKSPLEILSASIEETVAKFENHDPWLVGINPYNTDPSYARDTLNPGSDYQYDMELLKSQLHSLQEVLASINDGR